MLKAPRLEDDPGQPIPPVVGIADDERGEVLPGAEQGMPHHMGDLPAPLALHQAQVPVNEVQQPLGGLDDGELGSPRLAVQVPERNLVMRLERPARQKEVAVSSFAEPHIHLVGPLQVAEVVGQQLGLVVVAGAADVAVDLLQADDVGVLRLDDGEDPPESIAAVAAADSLMDVVTQDPHRWLNRFFGQFRRRRSA